MYINKNIAIIRNKIFFNAQIVFSIPSVLSYDSFGFIY